MTTLILALLVAAQGAPDSADQKASSKPTVSTQKSTKPPSGDAPSNAKTEKDREVRQIVLDSSRANKIYRVRTAIGYPATIEFPEAFTSPPTCGDCGDKTSLFRLDVYKDQHYLVVKPIKYPGQQEDGTFIAVDDYITTINVRLEHFVLTLQIELADRKNADARVVFTYPQRGAESQYVREEIDKARSAIEKEFATKLEHGVIDNFLRALSKPHHCSSSSARARNEDVVVEVDEICFYGQAVYIKFKVENRSRVPVQISEIILKKGPRGTASLVNDLRTYPANPQIDFQKSTVIVVGYQLMEGEEPSNSYEITVSDDGAKHRQVTVSEISL